MCQCIRISVVWVPVPKPSQPELPRQLIRDIAYARIREEILAGQFGPGERLMDDALVGWLQVSRTPIREALARLTADGLVEMEPNRYTRVVDRSAEAYARAAEYMQMIRGFVLDHLDRVPPEELAAVRTQMGKLLPALREHDRDAQVAFNDEFGELAALVGNPLIVEAEQRVRSQAQFHLQHEASVVNWDGIINHAEHVTTAQH